MTENQIVVLFV